MAKFSYFAVGLLAAAVSFNSFAQITVSVDRDIEVLVTNGEQFEKPMIGHAGKVVLPDGENQLLVRVAKIIHRDGEKEKFNSHPQVILFNAKNKQLELSLPKLIRTGNDADAYNKSPKLILTSNGRDYQFKSDVIKTSGLSLFRDYEELVSKYNSRNTGSAVVSKSKLASEANSFAIENEQATSLSADEQIKALFKAMPAEKQKDFISWAVQQLAD